MCMHILRRWWVVAAAGNVTVETTYIYATKHHIALYFEYILFALRHRIDK